MLSQKIRNLVAVCLFALLSILIAACQSTPTPRGTERAAETVVAATRTPKATQTAKVTVTPGITLIPTDTPDEIDQRCCAEYRIGLLQAPETLNYWAYLGEAYSVWTGYVIGDEAPSLYEIPISRSTERLDFIPALAADLPPEAQQQGDFWVISVEMLPASWSDGEAITARDVVFTIETVFDLQLGGRWSDFYPSESLADVKARGDRTVEFYFKNPPGLSEWQFAVAMGPILPQHYWAGHVAEARTYIEDIEPPTNCSGTLSEVQQSACEAYAQARQSLYAIEPVAAPSGGGYNTDGFTSDDTLRRRPNPNFYAQGVKISIYEDGTWVRTFPDGTSQQFYGSATGDLLFSYRRGPFSPSVLFTVYDSRIQAYDALSKGRLDTVLNPYALTDDWLLQKAQSPRLHESISQQNGLAYLGFNLRRSPFSHPELREALEVLIDRQTIVEKDLIGMVSPAYSVVPAANTFWWNPTLVPVSESPSQQERWDSALQILMEAGWSWKTEPSWNSTHRQITPGEGLRLPDGNPLPEVNLIYPDPATEPILAVFGDQVTELLTALGVNVAAETLTRSAIVNRTLIAGGSFDLYLLDWRFPVYPGYLCELFDSTNDTLLTGNYNTTGYDNSEFDELCRAFLRETDPQLAQDQAYQMQVLLATDRPYIPLFYPQIVEFFHENVIPPYLPELGGIVAFGGFQTDVRVLLR